MKAMKKILSLFAAVVAVMLSSCSNDDIPVGRPININVDPSTVVSSFIEYTPGEITTLSSNNKLRIRLLVYDENGNRVKSDSAFSEDYTHIKKFSLNLPEGKYITVAITDVVANNGIEFYTLLNTEKLTTTSLSYNSYIGGTAAILGLTTEYIYITPNKQDYNIRVKPAGALVFCGVDNWNDCLNYADPNSTTDRLDIKKYIIYSDKSQSGLTLNSSGEPIYSIKTADLNKECYLWFSATRNTSREYYYNYSFKFPMKNVTIGWAGETSTDRWNLSDQFKVEIEAGKNYYFILDMSDLETEWDELKNGSNAPAMMMKAQESKALMVDNVINFSEQSISMPTNEGKSIKPIDYLKQ